MKKIFIQLILFITLISLSQVSFAKVSDVLWSVDIMPETDWFILFWNKAFDTYWVAVETYEVLISEYPVWAGEYYEEFVKTTHNNEWVKILKFWDREFENWKDYYFSVIAAKWSDKSENYSMEKTWRLIDLFDKSSINVGNDQQLDELSTTSNPFYEDESLKMVAYNQTESVIGEDSIENDLLTNLDIQEDETNLSDPEFSNSDLSNNDISKHMQTLESQVVKEEISVVVEEKEKIVADKQLVSKQLSLPITLPKTWISIWILILLSILVLFSIESKQLHNRLLNTFKVLRK